MPSIAQSLIRRSDEAPAYWQIGNLWRVMVTGVQSDNSFTLIDQLVTDGGGGGPCTHTHTQDEGIYIISGQCTFNLGGKDGRTAGPGTFVSIPRLTQHSFTVDVPDTRLLNFYFPAGFEQLLTGVAHPAAQNKLPPPGLPLPPAWLVDRLAKDYGQTAVLGMPFKDPAGVHNMRTELMPGATLFPYLTTAKENFQSYWHAGGLFTVLASSEQTGNSFCLIEQLLPNGPGEPPHVHSKADEVFYILDGEATFLLEDRIELAPKDSVVFIPRGTVHAFRIDSPTAVVLNWCTPGGLERMLPVMGQRAREHTLPPPGLQEKIVEKSIVDEMYRDIGMRMLAVANPLDY